MLSSYELKVLEDYRFFVLLRRSQGKFVERVFWALERLDPVGFKAHPCSQSFLRVCSALLCGFEGQGFFESPETPQCPNPQMPLERTETP